MLIYKNNENAGILSSAGTDDNQQYRFIMLFKTYSQLAPTETCLLEYFCFFLIAFFI